MVLTAGIDGLLARIAATEGFDNSLDVAIDVALFKPDAEYVAVRPNAAGTKLVYTRPDGGTDTYRAMDWTLSEASRELAITKLRALESETPA